MDVLPPPSGFSRVAFREKTPAEDPSDPWPLGEVRHEAAAARGEDLQRKPGAQPLATGRRLPAAVEAKRAQAKELGYPEYPPEFDDPAWYKQQFEKERVDPHENPNLLLDPSDPEYWHNVARRPYARAILRSEQHWKSRKDRWLAQYKSVEELNLSREDVAEHLENCSTETKRLVLPIMKYKIVEAILADVNRQAKEQNVPFVEFIERPNVQSDLRKCRERLDTNGPAAAAELMARFDECIKFDTSEEDKKCRDEQSKIVMDSWKLKECLNSGYKCKKDGLIEWNNHNYEEAMNSWRQGNEILSSGKCPDEHEEEFNELHAAILKNLAQAAIKLECWTEALTAANAATRLDEGDHKAWYRKACALQGLGRLDEVEDCLKKIDEIAVGRPDRQRIEADTKAKREKIESLREQEAGAHKRMLQRGLKKGIFGDERDRKLPLPAEPAPPPTISEQVTFPNVHEEKRKRITRDGAWDLLQDLEDAYSDTSFQNRVYKLAMDLREHDKGEFICYLCAVALPVQRPVLERWGFPPTPDGVSEMTRAIQDHTRGPGADTKLRARGEQVVRVLYGDMYDRVIGVPSLQEDQRATPPAAGRARRGAGSDSDE